MLGQLGSALGRRDNLRQIASVRICRLHLEHHQLGVPSHRREQVVEIVRDATGQTTDRLHLLRLAQVVVAPLGFVVPVAQARRHRVEVARHRHRFGAAANGHLARPVAGGDIARGGRDVMQRATDAAGEYEAAGERNGEDGQARGKQLAPELVDVLPDRRPVLEEHQPAGCVRRVRGRQRKRSGHIFAGAEAFHRRRAAEHNRLVHRELAGQSGALAACQAARGEAATDGDVHLAMRDLRQLSRDRVVERVPYRQRPQRFLGKPCRLGDDEEQPIAHFPDIPLRLAAGRGCNHPVQCGRRGDAGGPSGACRPAAVGAGHDEERGLELLAVFIGHDLHRGGVAGQTRVGHVRAEHGQRCHQHGLRGGELGAIVLEAVEGRSGGREIVRRALERSGGDDA